MTKNLLGIFSYILLALIITRFSNFKKLFEYVHIIKKCTDIVQVASYTKTYEIHKIS